jgi:hypothetical protein
MFTPSGVANISTNNFSAYFTIRSVRFAGCKCSRAGRFFVPDMARLACFSLCARFIGSELPTLTEDDMKSLGITKIGQRKKLAKEISKAAAAEKASGSNSASNLKSGKGCTFLSSPCQPGLRPQVRIGKHYRRFGTNARRPGRFDSHVF